MSTVPVAASGPREGLSAVDWLAQRRPGPQTIIAIGIVLLSVVLTVFHFYSTYFGQTEIHAHRSTHLALMLLIALLVFPLGRRSFGDPLTWHFAIDLGLIAVALGSQIYTIVHLPRFVDPNYEATGMDVVVGTLLILAVLEATRRTVSPGLSLTAIFFLLQTWHADKFFWIFYGPPTSWRIMVESLYGRPEGLYGIPIAIMSGVLIIFIIFSAFLTTTGIGDFFVRLATGVAGRLTGGPAKVAVLSSALLGTISGSGVANVLMSGSFTIPMMKRVGYGARFAAAVEATASLGGQIMPPIMAAAAFIMADFIGVPFRQVAAAAVIPALLYFFSVLVAVHLEARRLGLQRVPWADMPSVTGTLRQDGHLILPVVALLWYLYQGFTEETAGLMAIATTYVLSFARRHSALTPERLLKALEAGGRIAATVAMAVATAGLIIGCLFLSGIAVQFSYILITLSGGQLWLALIYTTFAAFVLGLSLPTTAVYITLAIVIAPALVQMGVPPMAAHFFILYMGVCSDLTPPTCLSPFAAASIAGSPPMATAFRAMRLGWVLYIVPFMFVYTPALLLQGTLLEILHATVAAAVGVFCFAACLQGWVLRAATWPERLLLLAAAGTAIRVGLYTDLIGLGLLGTALLSQVLRGRREGVHALSPSLE